MDLPKGSVCVRAPYQQTPSTTTHFELWQLCLQLPTFVGPSQTATVHAQSQYGEDEPDFHKVHPTGRWLRLFWLTK